MVGGFIRWDRLFEGSPTQDGKEVAERGAFAPVVEYDDQTHAFGLPGLITEPWQAMKRWLNGGAEENVARMRTGLPFTDEAAGDAFSIAGSAAMGGVASPKPAGSIGTFGGKSARTADLDALAKAQEMAAKGADRSDIWKDTGWFKGADDKWRFEIDDYADYPSGEGALYRPGKVIAEIIEQGGKREDLDRVGYQTYLKDVYDHPNLYAAYPDMGRSLWASVPASKLPSGAGGQWGGLQGGGVKISKDIAPSLQSGRSVTLHEIQHGLQDIEGFAKGTNPNAAMGSYIKRYNELDDMITVYNRHELLGEPLDKAIEHVARVRGYEPGALHYAMQTHGGKDELIAMQQRLHEANGGTLNPHDWYKKHAGEVEARAVQSRMNMTADERRARPPWLDYDVPEDQQIIRGAFDPAKADSADLLAANPKEAAALSAAVQGEKHGIRAYHGSPYDFDRFDISKIGTGEGAQAYGPGLYFAEAEDVARSYRDGLAGGALNWDRFRTLMPELSDEQAAYIYSAVTHHDGASTPQQLATRAQYRFPDLRHDGGIGGPKADKLAAVFDDALQAAPGRMYEVRINADPNDFLDWDAPIYGQQKAFDALYPDGYVGARENITEANAGSMLAREGQLNEKAAQALREAGIPGIKYLDQGSRAAGEGSRNYVVFDDSLISIVKKYGIAGAASLYGMTQGEIEQALADQGQGGFIVAPEPTVE